MNEITAEKVANFVFDNAEIMKRQKAMDAFEKRLGMVNGMELKKRQIELNSAKLEKMDADIFKTRAQAQSTIEKTKQKMQPPPQQMPVMQQLPKMAQAMPGQSIGGMKPAASGSSAQPPKSTSFADAAKAGTETRQAPRMSSEMPKLPEAAPLQSAGNAPTNFVPQPVPPPEIAQRSGMPRSPVPVNMTATASPAGSLPKFASVSSLTSGRPSPNTGKTSFRSSSLSETIKLFPQINQSFKNS